AGLRDRPAARHLHPFPGRRRPGRGRHARRPRADRLRAAQDRARQRGPARAAAAGAAGGCGLRARGQRGRTGGADPGRTRLRSRSQRAAVAAAAQRAGPARERRHRGPAARRAGRPARARRKPARAQRARRAAVHHGLPRLGARQPSAHDSRDERAAQADGGDGALRTMQSWTPDLDAYSAVGNRSLVHEGALSMCRKGLWTGALLALALVGCNSGERTGGDGAEAADAVVADPAFVASNSAWREERRARLLEPDGWASLIGLHWIELPAHYVGSGATSGIRLAKGPERMGLLQQQGGKVYFTPEQDAGLTVGEEPVTERFELLPETSDTPTVVGFDEGKGQLVLIERGGRKALRVRHAEAETLTGL